MNVTKVCEKDLRTLYLNDMKSLNIVLGIVPGRTDSGTTGSMLNMTSSVWQLEEQFFRVPRFGCCKTLNEQLEASSATSSLSVESNAAILAGSDETFSSSCLW